MMERRTLIGGAMTIAAGMLASGTASAAPAGSEGGADNASMMDACIARCLDTHRKCLETAGLAARNSEHAATARLIAVLTDCAEICQATANSMLRGSKFHTIMCDVCAKACRGCEEECRRLSDTRFARCADSCHDCADSCAHMAMMSN